MKLAPNTFQGLHGDEVALFQKVLKGVSGIGVEIGCCDGFSSAVILEASELHLTSIDPFIPDSMEPTLIGSKDRYLENVAPWKDRAKLIEDFSYRAVLSFLPVIDDGPCPTYEEAAKEEERIVFLDFLFIDGDHGYKWVSTDFHDWTCLLNQGGILAMHDARMGRDGSPNFHQGPSLVAQEEVFGQPDKWEVIGEAFSLVLARKL
jgi:hypothetical protein